MLQGMTDFIILLVTRLRFLFLFYFILINTKLRTSIQKRLDNYNGTSETIYSAILGNNFILCFLFLNPISSVFEWNWITSWPPPPQRCVLPPPPVCGGGTICVRLYPPPPPSYLSIWLRISCAFAYWGQPVLSQTLESTALHFKG